MSVAARMPISWSVLAARLGWYPSGAHQHEGAADGCEAGIVVLAGGVGAPLEHVARHEPGAGHEPLTEALGVRADVHDQAVSPGGRQRLVRGEPLEASPGPLAGSALREVDRTAACAWSGSAGRPDDAGGGVRSQRLQL